VRERWSEGAEGLLDGGLGAVVEEGAEGEEEAVVVEASEASEGPEEVGEGAQIREVGAGGQQGPRVALRGDLLVEERDLLRKREERELL
jgi:hypothetical protein